MAESSFMDLPTTLSELGDDDDYYDDDELSYKTENASLQRSYKVKRLI